MRLGELVVRLEHLHENGRGLDAELWVEAETSGQRAAYHWSRVNLTSARSRRSAASSLATRLPGVRWPELLDYVCINAALLHRRGGPAVDLWEVPEEEIKWLASPLLVEGEPTTIVGDGGTGKSWLALLVAASVTIGRSLLPGLWVHRQGAVLYLDYEHTEAAHRRRLGWVARGFGIAPIKGIKYKRMSEPLHRSEEQLAAEVERLGVQLVVVDSAALASGGELNEANGPAKLFAALRTLGRSSLVIHHMSKGGAAQVEGRARAYGSVYWENLSRAVWEVRTARDPGRLHLLLTRHKANDGGAAGELLFTLEFNEEERKVRVRRGNLSEVGELQPYVSVEMRIREALRGGALTAGEIAREIGSHKSTVLRYLKRMNDVVQVTPSAPGRGGNEGLWGLRADG